MALENILNKGITEDIILDNYNSLYNKTSTWVKNNKSFLLASAVNFGGAAIDLGTTLLALKVPGIYEENALAGKIIELFGTNALIPFKGVMVSILTGLSFCSNKIGSYAVRKSYSGSKIENWFYLNSGNLMLCLSGLVQTIAGLHNIESYNSRSYLL